MDIVPRIIHIKIFKISTYNLQLLIVNFLGYAVTYVRVRGNRAYHNGSSLDHTLQSLKHDISWQQVDQVTIGGAWDSTKASAGIQLSVSRSDRLATCLRRCQMASTGSLMLHGYSDTPSIHFSLRRCPTNQKMGKMPAGDVPPGHSLAIRRASGWCERAKWQRSTGEVGIMTQKPTSST